MITGQSIVNGERVKETGGVIWQDPCRREVFSSTREDLLSNSKKIDFCIGEGLKKGNVFVITLGLVEVFYSGDSVLNQFPGYGFIGESYAGKDVTFKRQTAIDVEQDLRDIVDIIKDINPKNKIIFSVSPIPLQKTFSENDVFVANAYSKATLRSAVENVVDHDFDIYYFPSYEIAMNFGFDFYVQKDMRHAKPEYIDLIIKTFIRAVS